MSANKKFSLKEFFKRPLVFCLIAVLFTVLAGQMHIITDQYGLIEELLAENAELKESLADTEGKIDNILATQADIKNYHQELDRWFKGSSFSALKKIGKFLSFSTQDARASSSLAEGIDAKGWRLTDLEFAAQKARYDVATLFSETQDIKNLMLKIPSLTPARGRISSFFGKRVDPFNKKIKKHNGIDIAGAFGDPVYATAAGRVVKAKFHPDFGLMVEIDHENGFRTLYAHLSAIEVKNGHMVERGKEIAKVGDSGGRCKGPHLHYEVLKNGVNIDPSAFLAYTPPSSKAL